MDRIFTEEYAAKALGNDIYKHHSCITTKDAFLAVQEAIIDIQTLTPNQWTDQNNIRKVESLLEACFVCVKLLKFYKNVLKLSGA